MPTTIVLFEDNQCDSLRPVGLFRPLYDVRIASMSLIEMIRGIDAPLQTFVRGHFLTEGMYNPAILSLQDNPILLLNASVEPDVRYLDKIRSLIDAGDPFVTTSGNRVAAALVPPDRKFPQGVSSDDISSRIIEMGLSLESEMFATIDWPHEIVDAHIRLFETNLSHLIATDGYTEQQPGVFVRENVRIHPTCILETGNGPVVIGKDVTMKPFTYIEGPVSIGDGTRIIEHSAIKDRTSIGMGCKIGGELEVSSVDSRSNKQHHGFLGHSWVGGWVNLGAGTTTSDLKTTYGQVRMEYGNRKVETGMQFLGSIIGDYAKTAINTSLFTGKLVGVCSMVYGTVTKNVPSFSNYARSFGQVTGFSIEQVQLTQARMFARRGIEQTPYDVEILKRVFDLTRDERTMTDEQINF